MIRWDAPIGQSKTGISNLIGCWFQGFPETAKGSNQNGSGRTHKQETHKKGKRTDKGGEKEGVACLYLQCGSVGGINRRVFAGFNRAERGWSAAKRDWVNGADLLIYHIPSKTPINQRNVCNTKREKNSVKIKIQKTNCKLFANK